MERVVANAILEAYNAVAYIEATVQSYFNEVRAQTYIVVPQNSESKRNMLLS